jgi:tetratricopeptide (TPR) repeat protein
MASLRTKIQEGTRHVALDIDDKALMRERLVSYMEYKPLRDAKATHVEALSFGALFRAHHFVGALAIALIVTTSTVSVSSAASDALPGDLLYPVKVHINEGVKTVFMTSDEARIAYERQLAELRLEEASMLAAQGRLDDEAQEEVAKRFAEHTEAVVEKVKAVEESDPVLAAEASSEFAEALDTHEAVLARLIVEQEDEPQEGARDLVGQVHAAAAEAKEISVTAENIITETEESTDSVAEGSENTEGTPETGDSAVVTAVEVQEDITAKLESANLHVRAAYRAQVRAQEQLARATELVESMDQESELVVLARAQLESGTELMGVGEIELSEHHLGSAYSAYRNAAVKFQKVADLLEAAKLFDVTIYADSFDETEDAPVSEGVVASEPATVVETEDDEDMAQQLDAVHVATEDMVREARRLLLALEGFESETSLQANALIKDAAAHMLRAEIYRVLEENSEAYALYTAAHKYAERALLMLEDAAEERGVQEVSVPNEEPIDEPNETLDSGEVLGDVGSSTTTPAGSSTLKVLHIYEEGVHTFAGDLSVPTSCTEVYADLMVAESYPEQIVLTLTTRAPAEDVACTQTVGSKPFSVSTTASGEAVLMQVVVDGTEQEWVFVEFSDESESIGEEVNATNEEEKPGIFRRALESTQEMLGVE